LPNGFRLVTFRLKVGDKLETLHTLHLPTA
jgi:hypothetical protein